MVFNNVAEVFDSIEQTRSSIYEHVKELSEEQWRFRPADDQWSVVEIAEHLSVTESRMLQLIQHLVEQNEANTAPVDSNTAIPPISLESLATQIPAKGKAPEFLLPTGSLSLEETIRNLHQTREALIALKPRLQSRDFTPILYSRESFGPYTPYQLVAFIGYHEDRHLGQIAALVASESFPARQAAGA
ncbi:MAG TPA: DinB family protein [Blastocatellia bacterium]|nr:DinB family protein [Blastocatellia bacterium]